MPDEAKQGTSKRRGCYKVRPEEGHTETVQYDRSLKTRILGFGAKLNALLISRLSTKTFFEDLEVSLIYQRRYVQISNLAEELRYAVRLCKLRNLMLLRKVIIES